MALGKFNAAKNELSDSSFEVLNYEEAAMSRGGVLDCTCNNGSSYTSCPSKSNCTCDNGSSYSTSN